MYMDRNRKKDGEVERETKRERHAQTDRQTKLPETHGKKQTL